ncbi:hypothetical protein HKD37_07G019828 [Glycine soja]
MHLLRKTGVGIVRGVCLLSVTPPQFLFWKFLVVLCEFPLLRLRDTRWNGRMQVDYDEGRDGLVMQQEGKGGVNGMGHLPSILWNDMAMQKGMSQGSKFKIQPKRAATYFRAFGIRQYLPPLKFKSVTVLITLGVSLDGKI